MVAIGRNEGERLKRCLRSLVDADAADGVAAVVYVDSGSSDGSVEFARTLGVAVVALDLDRPFTAARARNAGVAALDLGEGRLGDSEGAGQASTATPPPLDAYFFLDGDCELVPGFLAEAAAALRGAAGSGAGAGVVAVGGRRRERFRDATPFNRLCDMEWDRPTGEVGFFGGEGLVDRAAFHRVGGFDETLIAGEEPELCLRLRTDGGRIWTVDHDVAVHDAAMDRLGQWWKRAERAGHAYAEGAAVNRSDEAYYRREVRSIVAYGWAVPAWFLGLTLASWLTGWAWLAVAGGLGLLAYPFLFWRVYRFRRGWGDSRSDAALYARYTVLGKFAGAVGLLRYRWNKARGTRQVLMEYKALAGKGG